MMALIIPCTSVTRDAFEIGHVVRMESQGVRMVTFPDGKPFRELLQRDFLHLARWVGAGIVAGGATAVVSLLGWTGPGGEVGPAILVCIVAAFCAHGAFLSGKRPLDNFPDRFKIESWLEACRFWTWPCLTFAFTYYLVQFGLLAFVFRVEGAALFVHLGHRWSDRGDDGGVWLFSGGPGVCRGANTRRHFRRVETLSVCDGNFSQNRMGDVGTEERPRRNQAGRTLTRDAVMKIGVSIFLLCVLSCSFVAPMPGWAGQEALPRPRTSIIRPTESLRALRQWKPDPTYPQWQPLNNRINHLARHAAAYLFWRVRLWLCRCLRFSWNSWASRVVIRRPLNGTTASVATFFASGWFRSRLRPCSAAPCLGRS